MVSNKIENSTKLFGKQILNLEITDISQDIKQISKYIYLYKQKIIHQTSYKFYKTLFTKHQTTIEKFANKLQNNITNKYVKQINP